jgi:hypothetical protein
LRRNVSPPVSFPLRDLKTRLTFGGTDLGPVWSPDGSRIAAIGTLGGAYDAPEGRLVLWNTASGQMVADTRRAATAASVAFSPDGRLVASADRPGIKTSIVRSKYQLNDALYVGLPKGSVARLGDTYMSYVLGPDLGDFGQVVIPTGILRIEGIASGQRSLARIIRQFAEIELDQRLTLVPYATFPTGSLATVSGGTRGKVLYVHDEPVLPSIGHYVLVSLSSKNGIKIGDEITFIDNSVGMDNETAAPPVVAGIGQVVRVTPFAASVIIVRQTQPTIRDGMLVRLTGTTP